MSGSVAAARLPVRAKTEGGAVSAFESHRSISPPLPGPARELSGAAGIQSAAGISGKRIFHMRRGMRTPCLPVAAIVAAAGVFAPAHAQVGAIRAGQADDLRAVYATTQDIAEGRRVMESCTRCHGANGVSATPGVPHVAGQRAAYLYLKLRDYQKGVRDDPAMVPVVKFLADDALVKVSAYMASLEPAQPAAAAAPPPESDPFATGRETSEYCGGCHGDTGVSSIAGMPSLVGMDPKYLVTAMEAYVNGQRKDDSMKAIIEFLTDDQIDAVALYYALQPPERAQTEATGSAAAGQQAAASCGGCHGEQGVSSNPANPSLAGQDARYLADTLRYYKSGARSEGTMRNAAAALDERTIEDLAAYYAAQQPQAPAVVRPLSTGEWVQRCDRCHGVNGNSTDPRTPAIAAQRPEYLERVLRSYQSGERGNSVMAAMAATLSAGDIEALAAHYSGQRARSFVYVVLPAR
jgi:cytochrome c553